LSDEKRNAQMMYHYLVGKSLSSSTYLAALEPETKTKALDQFYDIKLDGADLVSSLDNWLGLYLSKKQRDNMMGAIRQRKRRAMGVGKTITISEKAHRMLTTLADADGLTLSAALEKRLKSAYRAELGRKY